MPYLVTARYGVMRNLGEFVTEEGSWRRLEWAVLRTERGTELGDILLPPRAVEGEGRLDDDRLGDGRVLRRATDDDLARKEKIESEAIVHEYKVCRRLVRELGLPMKVVSVEHIFGGEKLVFYFTAEGRVDFRELVRKLAQAFHTRIEMRQIGARDEARLLGDVGHCGRVLCCKTFLRELEPVTMRMARSQKATLDPSKISGACGRLMCCLRYEDETYRELKAVLPALGTVLELHGGQAEVVGHDVLARRVHLALEGGRRLLARVEDLADAPVLDRRTPRERGPAAGRGDPADESAIYLSPADAEAGAGAPSAEADAPPSASEPGEADADASEPPPAGGAP